MTLCENCPNKEFFLVCIFLYLDWIRRFTFCIQSKYRKIWTRKNSLFWHFSRSLKSWKFNVVIKDGDKDYHYLGFRSSHQRCFIIKSVLRNSAKFTGKHLYQSLFFNKVAGLRPPYLQNTSRRFLLDLTLFPFLRKLNNGVLGLRTDVFI